MHCIEPTRSVAWRLGALAAALLAAACAQKSAPAPAAPAAPAPTARPAPAPAPVAAAPARVAPVSARTWNEFKVQAARKVLAVNPAITHNGVVQQPALAIPVLEIELDADGSIRKIDVMRKPSQALDTTQIAIDAVRRAAPFGGIGHLPKPWKYSEAFLFNDDRRFKPMSLDR